MTAIRGLSRRCYSASRRRVGTSMRMKPAATIAAFKSASARSLAVLRNARKVGHYDPPIVAGARRHRRGDDANYLSGSRSARATTRTTRAPGGPTQSTAVRSTLNWHPPHPETGPGDAHQ